MPIRNSGIEASTKRIVTHRKSVGVPFRCARNTPMRMPPVTPNKAAMPASVRLRPSRVKTSFDTGRPVTIELVALDEPRDLFMGDLAAEDAARDIFGLLDVHQKERDHGHDQQRHDVR